MRQLRKVRKPTPRWAADGGNGIVGDVDLKYGDRADSELLFWLAATISSVAQGNRRVAKSYFSHAEDALLAWVETEDQGQDR